MDKTKFTNSTMFLLITSCVLGLSSNFAVASTFDRDNVINRPVVIVEPPHPEPTGCDTIRQAIENVSAEIDSINDRIDELDDALDALDAAGLGDSEAYDIVLEQIGILLDRRFSLSQYFEWLLVWLDHCDATTTVFQAELLIDLGEDLFDL